MNSIIKSFAHTNTKGVYICNENELFNAVTKQGIDA